MAVQRLKSLEYTTTQLLRNNFFAVEAATSTSSPVPPPTLPSRPSATLLRRGRDSTDFDTASSQQLQHGGRKSGRPRLRNSCKYIVNPSRYPPSYLRAISQARLHHETLTSEANLQESRAWYAVNDCETSLQRRQSPFPAPLPPTSTLSYRKILLQIDHIIPPLLPSSTGLQTLPPILDPTVTVLSTSPPSPDITHASSFSPSPSPSPSPPSLDKPTPSQLAFVLLKLREEVSLRRALAA